MKKEPEIRDFPETKLIGKQMKMSFAENQTSELWHSFAPNLKFVKNNVSSELYSVEVYNDVDFFKNFNPQLQFEKWATIQVSDFDSVPEGLEKLTIPAGKYAVFQYKGKPANAAEFYRHIYETWLPESGYNLDNRPHFAVMGEKYKNDDPDSEEEIWIPVTEKDAAG